MSGPNSDDESGKCSIIYFVGPYILKYLLKVLDRIPVAVEVAAAASHRKAAHHGRFLLLNCIYPVKMILLMAYYPLVRLIVISRAAEANVHVLGPDPRSHAPVPVRLIAYDQSLRPVEDRALVRFTVDTLALHIASTPVHLTANVPVPIHTPAAARPIARIVVTRSPVLIRPICKLMTSEPIQRARAAVAVAVALLDPKPDLALVHAPIPSRTHHNRVAHHGAEAVPLPVRAVTLASPKRSRVVKAIQITKSVIATTQRPRKQRRRALLTPIAMRRSR